MNIELQGDTAYIPLLNSDRCAMVDAEDVDLVSQYAWYVDSKGYAVAYPEKGECPIYMHGLIVNAHKEEFYN